MAVARVAPFLFLFARTMALNMQTVVTGIADYSDLSTEASEDMLDYPTEFYYAWNGDDDRYVWRWNVEDFPDPQHQPRFCGRYAPSNVCDPDNLLKPSEADSLDELIRFIYNSTPCICENCSSSSPKVGIQIGIAVLKNTFMPYNEMPSKVIRSFALNLRSKWRLGSCNDDILIVVATNDRQSYTDVGKATSTYISQHKAYQIFIEHKGFFTEGRYYDGLKAMLSDYKEETQGIQVQDKSSEEKNLAGVVGIVIGVLVLFALLALFSIWIYKKHRKRQQGGPHQTSENKDGTSWRHRVPLLSSLHITRKDSHKVQIEDPIAERRQMLASITDAIEEIEESPQISEEEIKNESSNEDHQEEKQNVTLQSDIEEKEVMRTFLPNKSTQSYQTDL